MLHLTVSQSFVKSKLPFWFDGLFYVIFDDVQFMDFYEKNESDYTSCIALHLNGGISIQQTA